MKHTRFLFLIFILGSLIISGCLREYGGISITTVDVMSAQAEEGTKLTITPYIQNGQERDTGALTIKVKIKEPSTNLIVAEEESDMGYIKSQSSAFNSVTLTVSNPGEYFVEVQLFESGKVLTQYRAPVTVKAKPELGQPAEIKLTDMTLVVTKIYNDGSRALVDISPGIYNDGGDSKPLTIEVTARADPYTAYTKTDELGIVKGTSRVRGKVNFDIPRNREYGFTVSVIENGKTAVSGKVSEKIKLNEIKFNMPMIFVLVEEGKPKPAATPKEPGFEVVIALMGVLLVYIISTIVRIKR